MFIKPVCRAFADDVAIDGNSASVSANLSLMKCTLPATDRPGDGVPHAVTITLR